MNTAAVAPHFVHEAEAQQQYARISIPAWLHVSLDGRTQKFPVADLSAAGFSVDAGLEALRLRQVYNGNLVFTVDGFDVAIDVNFVPRSFDSMNGRCGCEFQGLGSREVSALRYLITASLSGEMVTAGDVLNTLSRDELTHTRKGKGSNDPGFFGMPRAMVGSLIVMLVGLFVITFVISALSDIYFVTNAESDVGATFDAPVWSDGDDPVGEGKYSVGQIDASGRPIGVTVDHLWAPSLQEVDVPEAQRPD